MDKYPFETPLHIVTVKIGHVEVDNGTVEWIRATIDGVNYKTYVVHKAATLPYYKMGEYADLLINDYDVIYAKTSSLESGDFYYSPEYCTFDIAAELERLNRKTWRHLNNAN